jgi:hypothetical protein
MRRRSAEPWYQDAQAEVPAAEAGDGLTHQGEV